MIGAVQVPVASLIDALPDALIVVGEDGIIYLANTQSEFLFGLPRTEIVGRSVDTLVPARFRKAHTTHRSQFIEHPSVRPMGSIPLYTVHSSGREIPVDISISPLMTAQGLLVLAILRRRQEKGRQEKARPSVEGSAIDPTTEVAHDHPH